MNVIFVQWGTKYSSEDVNALYNNLIEYNSTYSYHCYTDNPESLTILNCHWKSDPIYDRVTNYDVRIASGVITWTAGNHTEMWDNFIINKDYFLRKYKGIDRYIVHENYDYETFPDTYVQSFKHQKEIDYEPAIITYEEVDFESRNIK
jgi:hypothetical protein